MATVNEGETTPQPSSPPTKTGAKVSPARNALGVVLLLVAGTICVLEFSANFGFNRAVKAIEAKIPKDDASDPTSQLGELPSREEVERIIGRSPDGALVKEGSESKATYTWKGLLRKFVLTAYYSNGMNPSLIRITTN